MSLNLRPLDAEQEAARQAGLELAARLCGVPGPLTMGQVQKLYDVLLDISSPAGEALIAVGLAFGEQIAAVADFEWMRIADEFGDETCLAARAKDIFCAPISMIQKRIRRGEGIDLAELRDDIIATIMKRIGEERVDDR